MKKFKLFSRILFFINSLLALATLLAYAAPFVSPNTFWPLAFFGLSLPFLFLINVIFLLYWLFRAKSKFLLSLIILALGYKSIPSLLQFRFQIEPIEETDVKIMSFNVRVFDLYMWTKEKTTRNKIIDFLEEEDPDIICLQEFYHRDVQNPLYEFKTLDTLLEILTAKNYHAHYTTTLRKVDHWGLITFSKYPIINQEVVEFGNSGDNSCIYTDLEIQDKTIRVYNAHLASIKLEKRDYKAMQKINENEYSEDFDEEIKLLEKIKYGFEHRASQAELIQESIQKSPHPVIICGDFNDTPTSYSYRTIRGKLKDAYRESGVGLGRTYIGEFPSFRIDYILYDTTFTSKDYITHPVELSDHHPISTFLSFK